MDFKNVIEKTSKDVSSWAAIIAVGSSLTYLLGYLSLRFHLTAIGIWTDISLFDEKYFFEGAKFTIYFLYSLPILFSILLLFYLLFYILSRLFKNLREHINEYFLLIKNYCRNNPNNLALMGIIWSIIVIQIVMRQCFTVQNIITSGIFPDAIWLTNLLLTDNETILILYFSGLIFVWIFSFSLLIIFIKIAQQSLAALILKWSFFLLIIIEFILLPINYGILIGDKSAPRINTLGENRVLQPNEKAWLVWEANDSLTYFVLTRTDKEEKRELITLPRKDVKIIDIISEDNIFGVVHNARVKK